MLAKLFFSLSLVVLGLIATHLSATKNAWSELVGQKSSADVTRAQPCVNPGQKFLSDQSLVYHQLENLQKKLYERALAPPRVCPDSDEYATTVSRVCMGLPSAQAGFNSLSECVTQSFRNLEGEVPTRYEDLAYFFLLKHLANDIEKAARATQRDIRSSLRIGTLPTRSVNAAYLRFPGGAEPLVVFSSEFFIFANAVSKAVVALLEVRQVRQHEDEKVAVTADKERAKALLEQNPVIAEQFAEMLTEVLYVRNRWRHYYLSESQAAIYGWLQNGMELFAMGHEYAHAYLKHEAVTMRPFFSRPELQSTESDGPDEMVYSWHQEFAADYHGFELFLKALKLGGDYLGVSQWSADFFFTCVELLERAESVLKTGQAGPYAALTPRDAAVIQKLYEQLRHGGKTGTISTPTKSKHGSEVRSHPPAAHRRLLIRLAMKEHGILAQKVDLGNRLQEIVDLLWQHSLPHLKQMIAAREGRERKQALTTPSKDEVLIQVTLKHDDAGNILVWVDGVYYGMTQPGDNKVITISEKLVTEKDPRLAEAMAVLMIFQLNVEEIRKDEIGISQLIRQFRAREKQKK
jgi:hypothetical protein